MTLDEAAHIHDAIEWEMEQERSVVSLYGRELLNRDDMTLDDYLCVVKFPNK